ncbi:MAG TPA: hypothetical protein VFL78_12145 [Rhodanobacteraceae bacterium]|nr:hypothetical protein [Rhodanobacteraceae bacterium]
MRRSIAFVLCLGLSTVLVGGVRAAPPGHGREQASSSSAMIRFQRDLVNVLALRSEAEPLLGAALLARTLPDPPDYVNFHALIQRAAKAPDAGPGIAWAQLVDCDAKAACPNAEALATLKKKAADNAAVWLMVLGQAARDGDKDAAREALAKAAKATRYDDYAGISLAALAKAAAALPPPTDLYGKQGAANSAAGIRALLVFGLSQFQPLPGFQATARLCKDDKSLQQPCLELAKTLAWASSPLARSLGLHLEQTLSDDADTRLQARAARHDLVWQVHNFGELTLASQHHPDVAKMLLDLARNGGTRMSLILAALRAEHLPVDAPAGWEPPHKQRR